jgi:NAD(P)H dehydrogenase (quinone)
VLTESGHEGKVYDITTPPVSLAELARIASEVTGRTYHYEPVGDDVWDGRWRASGRSGWELDAGHTSYDALRAGELAVASDDFQKLTGSPPLSVAEIVARRADELPL